jgi:hypothetical protein
MSLDRNLRPFSVRVPIRRPLLSEQAGEPPDVAILAELALLPRDRR